MNNAKADEFENVDKAKLKLFVLSILWRCSISKLSAFIDVKLGAYQEKIRKMVLNQDAGTSTDFPFAVFTTLQNRNWSDDVVAVPIRDKFNSGSYYKILLGGFIFVSNISIQVINPFFQSDETKIIVYHLPSHITINDFGNKNFLSRIFAYFAGITAPC